MLGLLAKRHRDMARLRNQHCTRLHALLGELHAGGIASEMTVAKANDLLNGVEALDEVTRCRLLIAGELVEDITRLDASLKASKKRVKGAVLASGTTVTDVYGVGPISAAMIIGHVRDIGRFPTKGHFATYNATAPIAVLTAEGRLASAACALSAAAMHRETLGEPVLPPYRRDHQRLMAEVASGLGPEAFSAAWTQGQAPSEGGVANPSK